MDSLNSHTQTTDTGLSDFTAKDFFLNNPYLISQTFSHLQVEDDREYCLSLFNAALTCKHFLDAALDALWENLDSLIPLLRLLPALCVEDNAYVLSGDISQADWNRLEYYPRKVKVFYAMPSNIMDPQFIPSIYIRIAQLQSSALFPSLRHLCCQLEAGSTSHIFLFLSPSLESLELTNIAGSENTFVRPFLDTLSSAMLKWIVLRNGWLSCGTLKYIARFKQLQSLELAPVDTDYNSVSWEVIGTLPSLVNLTLKVINSQAGRPPGWQHLWEGSNNGDRGPKHFNALETLHVTTFFHLIRHLLKLIDSPCLKSIQAYAAIESLKWEFITAYDRDSEKGRLEKDLLDTIATVGSKWPKSLENFVIGQHNVDNSKQFQFQVYNRFSDSITELLRDLNGIRTFHVQGWRIIVMCRARL
ncbi:hypothetical protein BYT27DRAFT_7261408 [Phlegmacium glaucopus]|nr:hypothetical protein BYT27DRAFT_7261408 [Phlegmacium glaucopus]